MSVTEFLLDWKQYEGKVIRVTNCAFAGFGTTNVHCYDKDVLSVSFWIVHVDELPREDRKVFLGCKAPFSPNCIGDLTGVVSYEFGTPSVRPVGIFWRVKPGGMM
jgi:hypothetical protein